MAASRHVRPTDLRAAAQLATQATRSVTRVVEGVHQSVWSTWGVRGSAPGQTGGITGFVYRTVHGVTALVGKGLQAALTPLEPLLAALVDAPPETPQREAVLAALNGVMGDRLAESHNPLATPMTLRHQGQALHWGHLPTSPAMPTVNGKVLVMIHGLCMNDLQWHTTADDGTVTGHGNVLAATLGYTPVYVRYNTGLHTSENGHLLAHQLAQLVQHWPVPVEEITVVAHSMGGLVTRSAVVSAQQSGAPWLKHLKNIVFLGTPHHGAPLERAGNWIDTLLGSTPYTRPFARLVQLRSAGITDLRYGHVVDADWQGHDRFRRKPDTRVPVPLPQGIACFTVAAAMAGARSVLAERLLGDGLVPLNSALGQHGEAHRSLVFAKTSQRVMVRLNHMELLSAPQVGAQLVAWLTPAALD
jgi:pimeloyl-ACP methyl ester carboxylesterase